MSVNKNIETLKEFYQVGPVFARELLTKLADLKYINAGTNYTHAEFREILKKIQSDLPASLQMDLLYHPLRVIPRPIVELLDQEFNKYGVGIKFNIAGSYIRGRPTSGDIDFVISKGNHGADIWDYFSGKVNQSHIVKILPPFARGEDKVATLVQINIEKLFKNHPEFKNILKPGQGNNVYIKLDAFLADPDEYLFAMLYAIGSGKFNLRMRAVAKRKGYLLNQRGLYKRLENDVLEAVPIKNEKDIFDILNIRYKIPSKRVQ